MRRLFRQLIERPLAAFASSVEMLGQRIQGTQRIDGMISRIAHTLSSELSGKISIENRSQGQGSLKAEAGVPEKDLNASGSASNENDDSKSPVVGARANGIEATCESQRPADTNLRDDMLKLVRYKLLFVRRQYEHAFEENEELVTDNMDPTAFIAWKTAVFIQSLARGETEIPKKWREKGYPPDEHRQNGKLTGLPDAHKKYLRVSYEVLERYPREKLNYEGAHIRVLEQIRDRLEANRNKATVRTAAHVPPGSAQAQRSTAKTSKAGRSSNVAPEQKQPGKR